MKEGRWLCYISSEFITTSINPRRPDPAAEVAASYEKRGSYTLIVDLGRHEVTYQGVRVTLPPMAFRLLSVLGGKGRSDCK